VTSAEIVESDIGSAEVDQGVADVIRRIRFPAAEGGGAVVVSYPIVFERSEDDAGGHVWLSLE
jgi:hypothetical protein